MQSLNLPLITRSSLPPWNSSSPTRLSTSTIGKTNIFILKCKSSGWTWAQIAKDKTAETTCQVFEKYIDSYDRARLVISDCGPAFSTMFFYFLSSHYIDHIYSSYYRAQSNSPAERGVRSIKDVLRKIPSFNKKQSELLCLG